MQAHQTHVVIPENHEVVVRLPEDFPTGHAEVIFLTRRAETVPPKEPLGEWLTALLAALPQAPALPLSALRREDMYE
jgi:hypothetical protein